MYKMIKYEIQLHERSFVEITKLNYPSGNYKRTMLTMQWNAQSIVFHIILACSDKNKGKLVAWFCSMAQNLSASVKPTNYRVICIYIFLTCKENVNMLGCCKPINYLAHSPL